MLTFNGNQLLVLHERVESSQPEIHAQRTQFAGLIGESQIILGVGGRELSVKVWLTDSSFGSAAAVDQYRQGLDQSVGTTASLVVSGPTQSTYHDVCFEGYTPTGSILPAIGGGLPAGTYWQAGILHFHQLTVP